MFDSQNKYIVYTAMGIAILFWGSAFTAITIGLEIFGAGELAVLRFSSASVLAAIIWYGRIGLPQRKDAPRLIIVSFFGITGYHLLLNFGQRIVPPGTASLLVQTVPMWTALLASCFGREHIRSREWFGVAIAFTGAIVIIIGQGKGISFSSSALLILTASFSTAVYFVFGRPLTIKYGSTFFTAWTIWIGTIPMLIFLPSAITQLPGATLASILAVLYLGVCPTVIAYAIWMNAIKKIGASRTTFFLYISPIVAIFTAWLWYGIIPTMLTFTGGAMAIIGVIIINSKRNPAKS